MDNWKCLHISKDKNAIWIIPQTLQLKIVVKRVAKSVLPTINFISKACQSKESILKVFSNLLITAHKYHLGSKC